MSHVFNLTIGDDGATKIIMTFSGVFDEKSPTSRLANAALDAVNTLVEELEQEGINVQYTLFDRTQKGV